VGLLSTAAYGQRVTSAAETARSRWILAAVSMALFCVHIDYFAMNLAAADGFRAEQLCDGSAVGDQRLHARAGCLHGCSSAPGPAARRGPNTKVAPTLSG